MAILIPVYQIPARSNKAKGRQQAILVGHAIVDDDMARLQSYFWTSLKGYPKRYEGGQIVFMHHDVIGRRPGLDVSHGNGNPLDNQRHNLSHATRSQNMLNPADGPTVARRSCPYRGVTRDDRSRSLARPWRGKMESEGKTYQTKRYATAEEARDALEGLRASLRVRALPWERPR